MRNESDVIDVQAKNDEQAESLKTIGWVSYLLHLIVAVAAVFPLAQASPGLLIVALVIDFVKKADAQGTWQASHFSWRIRTVLWAGVLYILTAPVSIMFLLLWNPAWLLVSIWFLYRIVKGMVRMNASQPMPD
jgi:uncharacterized membrane protein